MSYNWQDASTPQGRERLKELMELGIDVIGRDTLNHGTYCPNPIAVFTKSYSGRICIWDQYVENLDGIQFLDPSPQQPDDAPEGYHVVTFAKDQEIDENGLIPTDDEISFVASDESNHHDWMDLGFRNTYQQGFEDGAKWIRNKKTT